MCLIRILWITLIEGVALHYQAGSRPGFCVKGKNSTLRNPV